MERLIHGPEQPYNDVALWNYSKALEFFGPNVKSESHTVTTPEELEMLLDDPGFAEPTRAKVSNKYPLHNTLLVFSLNTTN